jgi:hypothetical protein
MTGCNMSQKRNGVKISNEMFVRAIFGEEWRNSLIQWTDVGAGREDFTSYPAGEYLAKMSEDSANYFCVSTFHPIDENRIARRKQQFKQQHVFVVDDVNTKICETELRATMPEASYILETSAGNFQFGYILTDGTDARALTALVDAIIGNPDLCPDLRDPGMASVTRVVRLPVGCNRKTKWLEKTGGKGWPHALHTWAPERVYSVSQLAMYLGADVSEQNLEKYGRVVGARRATLEETAGDDVMQIFARKGMLIDDVPNDAGFVTILCPWREEHTKAGDEAGYFLGRGGFKCHHGHCQHRNMSDLKRWIAEEAREERAEVLAEAFAAVPIDWNRVAEAASGLEDKETYHVADFEPGNGESDGLRGVWYDGDAAAEPVATIVEKILPARGLTFLGGQSGAGKSFLAIDLSVAVATNGKFFGLETDERRGVVYIAAEGAATLSARLTVAKMAREIEGAIPFAVVRDVPDLSDNDARTRFLKSLRTVAKEIKKRHGVRVGLVVIDTLGAAFSMRDENSAAETNQICRAAAELGDSVKAATLVLAHFGKSENAGIRGSSAIRGAAESIIAALGERSELTGACSNRRLVHIKSRDGEEGEAWGFELEHVSLGQDARGRPFGAAKIVRTGKPQTSSHPRSKAERLRVAFEAVYARLAAGVAETTDGDGVIVRKVALEAIREELKGAFLELDEKGRVVAGDRKLFGRVREELIVAGVFAQEGGLLWRVT